MAFDIVIHNIEPLPHRAVVVRWRPEVVLDLFLELGELFSEQIDFLIGS
jgi:hypothetical protein